MANHAQSGHCKRKDTFFWVIFTTSLLLYGYHFFGHFLPFQVEELNNLSHHFKELIHTVWWGIGLGILSITCISTVPRQLVMRVLGTGKGARGILRATLGGVLLDLCSHGILLVGAKLYERGATIGQVVAFLLASPWNSFSFTLVLFALVGLKWTLTFVILSFIIGFITGVLFDFLVKIQYLKPNPMTYAAHHKDKQITFKSWFKDLDFNLWSFLKLFINTSSEIKMLLRWLLLGLVLAASMRTFVDVSLLSTYFGPTLLGLSATMVGAIVIEICSEGSTPIAAELLTTAKAPGNAFAFLMGGGRH